MADLIIKPNSATGDKLILQDRAGGAVLTTASSGATIANIESVKLTPGTDPSSPAEGQIYYNASENLFYIYGGSTWKSMSNMNQTEMVGKLRAYGTSQRNFL